MRNKINAKQQIRPRGHRAAAAALYIKMQNIYILKLNSITYMICCVIQQQDK